MFSEIALEAQFAFLKLKEQQLCLLDMAEKGTLSMTFITFLRRQVVKDSQLTTKDLRQSWRQQPLKFQSLLN